MDNGKVEIIPITTEDKQLYLLSELGVFLTERPPYQENSTTEQASEKSYEIQQRMSITTQLINSKKFLNELIPNFIGYLLGSEDNEVTYDKKLALYVLVSEEYRKVLDERDITSMTILGQKTVLMIINEVYTRINETKELKDQPKEKLTL